MNFIKKIIQFLFIAVVVLFLYLVSVYLFGLLGIEKEYYISSIETDQKLAELIDKDNIEFLYDNREDVAIEVLVEDEQLIISDKNNRDNRESYTASSVSVLEEAPLQNDGGGYVVGFTRGGVDILIKSDGVFNKQSISFEDPVIGISWVAEKIFLIVVNDNYQIDFMWIVRDKSQVWQVSSEVSTQIEMEYILPLQKIEDFGVFAQSRNGIIFFSVDEKNYKMLYGDVFLEQVLGTKDFYVIRYEKDVFDYFDVVIKSNIEFSWRERKLGVDENSIDRFPVSTETKENNSDAYNNALISSGNKDYALYSISEENRTIEFRKDNYIYIVDIP